MLPYSMCIYKRILLYVGVLTQLVLLFIIISVNVHFVDRIVYTLQNTYD